MGAKFVQTAPPMEGKTALEPLAPETVIILIGHFHLHILLPEGASGQATIFSGCSTGTLDPMDL